MEALQPLRPILVVLGFFGAISTSLLLFQQRADLQSGFSSLREFPSERVPNSDWIADTLQLSADARKKELQQVEYRYRQNRKGKLDHAWEAYKETHAKALSERRFVLYAPGPSGHADRLPGVVTAFMLALASSRALVIDYCECAHNVEDCICQWSDFFEQEELEVDAISLLKKNPELKEYLLEGSREQIAFIDDAPVLNLDDLEDKQILKGRSDEWTGEFVSVEQYPSIQCFRHLTEFAAE
jgi:hypothetical protein